jgi:hypothetical protein
MYNTPQRNVQQFFDQHRCPVTIGIIAFYIVAFILLACGAKSLLVLAFTSPGSLSHPWTYVTWPLLPADPIGRADNPINVLFACWWAFWVGGSLERSWGARTFAVFFFCTVAVSAIGVALGGQILHQGGILVGLWAGIAPPTIAWCYINRRQTVKLWAIVEVPAWFIAVFTLVVFWYNVGVVFDEPALGICGLLGCLAAYLYARYGLQAFQGYAANPVFRANRRPKLRVDNTSREPEQATTGISLLRHYRAWQDRRKLERLWKRSMGNDREE